MQITIHGATQFGRKLQAAREMGPQAMIRTLQAGANHIMAIAKRDYVPVDTGALRASGIVEAPVLNNEGATIELAFGGPTAPYAVLVHEDLTKRHPVGQAKYLEIPVRAAAQGMLAVLNQREGDVLRQAFQRASRTAANIAAGRRLNWGMPLFGID